MTTISGLTRIIPGHVLRSLFQRKVAHSGVTTRLANLLLDWQDRLRQRHALAQMDDSMLSDLGLSRADVATETRKGFWQA